jgi:hypothetical protein
MGADRLVWRTLEGGVICVGLVGKIVLPGTSCSEDSRDTMLIRDISSALLPDLADDKVRSACKRSTVSASTFSPHFVLAPACTKTERPQPSMSLLWPTRSRCI